MKNINIIFRTYSLILKAEGTSVRSSDLEAAFHSFIESN